MLRYCLNVSMQVIHDLSHFIIAFNMFLSTGEDESKQLQILWGLPAFIKVDDFIARFARWIENSSR